MSKNSRKLTPLNLCSLTRLSRNRIYQNLSPNLMKILQEGTTKIICEENEEDTPKGHQIPISLRNSVSPMMHALHSVKFLSRWKPKRRKTTSNEVQRRGTIFPASFTVSSVIALRIGPGVCPENRWKEPR